MNSLEKERELFNSFFSKASQTLNIGSYEAFETWFERAKLAKAEQKNLEAEIESLKAQLAQYQSDDYVLVPKKPNSKLLKALRVGFYWDENIDSAAYSPILGYKNMIEAQE